MPMPNELDVNRRDPSIQTIVMQLVAEVHSLESVRKLCEEENLGDKLDAVVSLIGAYRKLALSGVPLLMGRKFAQFAFLEGSESPKFVDLVNVTFQHEVSGFIQGSIDRVRDNPSLDLSPRALVAELDPAVAGSKWHFVASSQNGRLDGTFHPRLEEDATNSDSFGVFVLHPWRHHWGVLRGAYSRYRDDLSTYSASVTIQHQERRLIWVDATTDSTSTRELVSNRPNLV
jgi:hypothetical protein